MFQHSEADVKKIKAVQFGIISPEETKKMSVCHVETDRTFENGRPVPGGLQDLRLGTVDRDWKCTSCGMAQDECPGHFGHIELAAPMYHYSFLNNTLKTLRCVCYSCSAILGDEPVDDVKGPDGTSGSEAIKEETKVRTAWRALRKLPFQAHAFFVHQPQCSVRQFLDALLRAVGRELECRAELERGEGGGGE